MSSARWLRTLGSLVGFIALALVGCAPQSSTTPEGTTGNTPQQATDVAPPCVTQQRVILIASCTSDASSPGGLSEIKAAISKAGRSKVAWFNATSAPVTITFTTWPFAKADSTAITIPPGKASRWFRVDPQAPEGSHFYTTVPSYHPCPTEGPGEPAIIVGG